jgi:rieske iron-sulfur protein
MFQISRRTVMCGSVLAAAGEASVARAAQGSAAARNMPPQLGDLLVLADTSPGNIPLKPADLKLGADPYIGWAFDPKEKVPRDGTRLNQVLLMRFDPSTLTNQEKKWAAQGVVAFSAICTHQGCTVIYWLTGPQVLECPCHQSQYNPRDGAVVVGGPAPRPLPALPLTMAGGLLVVAASFTDRVGGEQQR